MQYRRDLMRLRESKLYARNMKLKSIKILVGIILICLCVIVPLFLIGQLFNIEFLIGFGSMGLGCTSLVFLVLLCLLPFRYKIYTIHVKSKNVYRDDEKNTVSYYLRTPNGKRVSIKDGVLFNRINENTTITVWMFMLKVVDFYTPLVTSSNITFI